MKADVCIITEGTYPFVMGGVSTWIAQLLESMPHLRFSILHIAASPDVNNVPKYKFPPNLTDLSIVYLFESPTMSSMYSGRKLFGANGNGKRILRDFYMDMVSGRPVNLQSMAKLISGFRDEKEFNKVLAHGKPIWDAIVEFYQATAPVGLSFLDFFWTMRALFLPVLHVLTVPIPSAWVYHAACTGYAGLIGARASQESGRPLLLTEHGIYSRERRIELLKIDWLSKSGAARFLQMERSRNWFREWWIQLFHSLSRSAYGQSSHIVSLYEGNRQAQIQEGAPARRISLIPNGIVLERFINIPRRRRRKDSEFRIGFVGRVTTIKDVKTFLRALGILREKGLNFSAKLVGPMDEEPEYTDECLDLAQSLDLYDNVVFTGPRRDLDKVYAEMDVVVLTSVSEGFPFIILEANCAALPVVATNVGACAEIMNGMNREDKKIGPSGLITPVNSPEATAEALMRLAADPDLAQRMGEAGRERARRYYDLRRIMGAYQELYESYIFAVNAKKDEYGLAAKAETRIVGASETGVWE